jgi:hypothetical protein
VSGIGRTRLLQQRVGEELESARQSLGPDVALAGFYSYGELAPSNEGAPCELHNQTMTIARISERSQWPGALRALDRPAPIPCTSHPTEDSMTPPTLRQLTPLALLGAALAVGCSSKEKMADTTSTTMSGVSTTTTATTAPMAMDTAKSTPTDPSHYSDANILAKEILGDSGEVAFGTMVKGKFESMPKGADLDTAFVIHEIADHKDDITDANAMKGAAQNAEVKAFVEKTIPALQKHLDRAQKLPGARS